jgi:hypothetical protein
MLPNASAVRSPPSLLRKIEMIIAAYRTDEQAAFGSLLPAGRKDR